MIQGRMLAVGPLRADCRHDGWRPGRVLDPFAGAGTTAVAAEMYGRDWLGIEINPDYAALSRSRIAEWRARHNQSAS
jgi:DNA modification methylase